MKKNYQDAIPKNTSYCYTFLGENGSGGYNIKPCKYFKYKRCGKKSKNHSTVDYDNKKIKYGYYEYCKLLKRALSIGDACKDCGIGEECLELDDIQL